MSNPFNKILKNAKDSGKDWGDSRETSEAKSRSCEQCGAARPKDTNLTTCDYCGFAFMTIASDVRAEN